jgi:hypothetical protein
MWLVVTQNGIQRCRFESLVKELEKFFYGFDVLVLGGGPGSVTDDVSRVVNQVECFLKCQRFKAAREFIPRRHLHVRPSGASSIR